MGNPPRPRPIPKPFACGLSGILGTLFGDGSAAADFLMVADSPDIACGRVRLIRANGATTAPW